MDKQRKIQLATDYYQLTVSNVYASEKQNKKAVFDMFTRKNPFDGGYTVFAGLEQVIEYINQFRFSKEDIDMLHKNHPEMTDYFLDYLKDFEFRGELYAMEEGSIFFPTEPIIRVKANLIEAQLVETTMLSIINHQSLIATKAARVTREAGNTSVLDFGIRRAHGVEAGLYGSRACMIGGCSGTSNVEAEYRWDLVSKGTISHAFVMSFESEIEAFRTFAKYDPNNLVLLADTYDTLGSGVPNAIKVFEEEKKAGRLKGAYGIRLDSGDLAYLSKQARKMFDEAGFTDAKISASSDLDEHIIANLKAQGACIDMWGVGTKMMTAYDCPALGAVYKLSQIETENKICPKMKISNDPIKVTNPGYKKVVRCYDKTTKKATADLIMLNDEVLDETKPLTIYHPIHTWKKRTLTNFTTKDMLKCIYKDGKQMYSSPSLKDIIEKAKEEKETFWPEYMRLVNPNEFHVDLSDKLYELKKEFLAKH